MTATIEIVRKTLADLEEREAALAPLVTELDTLRRAVKDTRALLQKLEGKGPKRAIRAPRENTQAARALEVLRGHPRGLATKVISRETDIPEKHLSSILVRLVAGGFVTRPTTGFYKIIDKDIVDLADAA